MPQLRATIAKEASYIRVFNKKEKYRKYFTLLRKTTIY